jgi:segregation and condensation protein A
MTEGPETTSALVASARQLLQSAADKSQQIEEIALTDLISRYLDALSTGKTLELDEAGEFVLLAARLMVLKSEHLLPHETVSDRDDEPEGRSRSILIDRVAIASGASFLHDRYGHESFAPLPHPYTVERPIEPRSPSLLTRTWAQMQKRSGETVRHVVAPAFVRLEVAVSTIIRNLRSGQKVRLGRLLRDASRQDAVMHFLAVLELVRIGQARAEQPGLFADIVIERNQPAGDEDLETRAG